jgi:hypothetical protein
MLFATRRAIEVEVAGCTIQALVHPNCICGGGPGTVYVGRRRRRGGGRIRRRREREGREGGNKREAHKIFEKIRKVLQRTGNPPGGRRGTQQQKQELAEHT